MRFSNQSVFPEILLLRSFKLNCLCHISLRVILKRKLWCILNKTCKRAKASEREKSVLTKQPVLSTRVKWWRELKFEFKYENELNFQRKLSVKIVKLFNYTGKLEDPQWGRQKVPKLEVANPEIWKLVGKKSSVRTK